MKETKSYGCNNCGDGPCSITTFVTELNTPPKMKCGDVDMPLFPLVKKPNTHINIDSEKYPIPNCAVCRWVAADYKISIGPAVKQESILTQETPINYDCLAQGGKDACNCWNNDECKALFEPVEKEKPALERGICIKCKKDSVLVDPETRICRFCDKGDSERSGIKKSTALDILQKCYIFGVDPKEYFSPQILKGLSESECSELSAITPYPLQDVKSIFWSGK